MRNRALEFFALAVVGVFSFAFVIVPIGHVLAQLRWASMTDPSVLAILGASVAQASASTFFSVALGFPLGLWAGRVAQSQGGRGVSRLAWTILALPYTVPTVVAATTWVAWLGTHGILREAGFQTEWLYSLRAVVFAHVFLNAPWVALLVGRARLGVPLAEIEAARSLGAGVRALFVTSIWPRVRGALAVSACQVFALCVMSFAIVLILGGGPPVETLETAIYSKLRFSALDFSGAAGCAAWQLLLTLIPWGLALRLQSSLPQPAALTSARKGPAGRSGFLLVLLAAVFVVPYLAVAFVSGGRSLGPVSGEVVSSLVSSLELATGVSLVAMGIAAAGLVATRTRSPWVSRAVQGLLSLPAGISALVLGLGVWVAYQRWLDPFSGSLAAIVLVQATLFTPLAYRALFPLLANLRTGDLDAAQTLGASRWKAFWLLEWPRWRGPAASAAGMVAGAALSELAAVSLFQSEHLVPLPLLVSRWMAQYRFAEAQSLSSLLLVLALGIVGLSALAEVKVDRLHR